MPQQLTCLEQLANWLEFSKNPQAVVYCLEGQLAKVDAGGRPMMQEALADITALWCHQHGEEVMSLTDEYTAGAESIKRYLKQARRAADSDEAQLQWVAHVKHKTKEILRKGCGELFCLINSGALQQPAPGSYTGSRTVDAILVSMLVLPSYVAGLQQAAAVQEAQRRGVVHAVSASESHHAGHHDDVPVKSDQQNMGTSGTAEDMMQAKMEAVVNYERAKPFELLCALAYMSGRSMAELLCTGEFKLDQSEPTCAGNRMLFRPAGTGDGAWCCIEMLCEPMGFVAALARLRTWTGVAPETSVKSINRSHCKTANTAAKALLQDKSAVFTDLRALYVASTFAINHHEAIPATDARLREWARNCMP